MRILILTLFFIFNLSNANANTKKVRYGILVPLTGSYAKIGEEDRRGVELALQMSDLKNTSVELIYGDSQADPKVALAEFKRLTDSEGAEALFVMRSPVGMTVNPISKQKKIPIFGGVGHTSFVPQNEYAFQFWTPSDEEGAFIANEILQRKFKKIALFTLQDEWTINVSDGFRKTIKNSSASIVYDQEVLAADTDFRSIISKLRTIEVDTIFVNVGLAQIGPLLKQLREQNIQLPRFSTFWCAKKEVIDAAAGSAEDVLFAEMKTTFPKFREAVLEKYGEQPSAAVLSSYASTLFLIQALENSPASLYQALLSKTSVKLPDIELPIVDRRVKFPLVLRIIKDGQAKDHN